MHPLFNQQLAKYHLQKMQREAETAHLAAHVHVPEKASSRGYHLNFLQFLRDRTKLLYRRPVVLGGTHPEVVNFEEIKPALMSTFSVMHERGLVSEYDDKFVEKFAQTFKSELVYQSTCKYS